MISPNDNGPVYPTILEANLHDALVYAIQALRDSEKKISPDFCSTFRTGLEGNLRAMRAGHSLQIKRN